MYSLGGHREEMFNHKILSYGKIILMCRLCCHRDEMVNHKIMF